MANYSVNITDNGDGTFAMTSVLRAPTTVASGGTNLDTTTANSGFQQAASATSLVNGQKLRSPAEVLIRAGALIMADRSFNG